LSLPLNSPGFLFSSFEKSFDFPSLKKKQTNPFFISSFSLFFISPNINWEEKQNVEKYQKGQKLFFANCNVCHMDGKNLIIPEKNLKKETLEINGMNTLNAIVYQITNGKNGMPAFGGRLIESEIEEIAFYVLQQSN
jgi:cytochrome c6